MYAMYYRRVCIAACTPHLQTYISVGKHCDRDPLINNIMHIKIHGNAHTCTDAHNIIGSHCVHTHTLIFIIYVHICNFPQNI